MSVPSDMPTDRADKAAGAAAELSRINADLQLEIAERKQAEEMLRLRVLELAVLHAVASAGVEATGEDELIERATQVIGEALYPDNFGVLLLDEAAGVLRVHPSFRIRQDRREARRLLIPLGLGISGQVAANGRPRRVSDVAREEEYPEADPQTRSKLCVPLKAGGRVIGVISAESMRPGVFSEADERLLTTCAEQLATAIEKIRLFQAEARRRRELEALVVISSALRQALTGASMLLPLLEKSIEVLGADAGALLLLKEGALVLAAGRGPGEAWLGRQYPPDDDSPWTVVQSGVPLFIPDAGQSELGQPGDLGRVLMQGMAAAVFVPLKTAEATVGLLHLAYRSRREFSEGDRGLLTTIAEMAGSALQRANVMETLEQRVADRTRELAALYDVSAVASESPDLQTTLERSLGRALVAMQSAAGTIHLLDETEETLHLAARQPIPPAAADQMDASMPPSHLTAWIIQHGEPLVIPDLAADPQAPPAAPRAGPRAYAGVPMQARRRVLGVLSVVRESGQQFNVEEMALLASIADQVAVAVENARLHQQAEQAAVMEERARLARELHDSVTQSLYSVTLLADATRDFTEAGEWERVKHYLVRISETGRQALKEMRLLLYELRPPIIEEEGLLEALSRRLDAVEGRAGVEVRLLATEWVDLPAPVEEALYHIAQEALNNALKHAEATTVTVQLHGDAGGVDLEVVDNGKGFDPDSVKRRGGMGLLSMRQRTEMMGGQLTILSAPGEGTRVKVELSNVK
jgi:signal transduction histidine kinase